MLTGAERQPQGRRIKLSIWLTRSYIALFFYIRPLEANSAVIVSPVLPSKPAHYIDCAIICSLLHPRNMADVSQSQEDPKRRYIPNDVPAQPLDTSPEHLMQTALEKIVKDFPPLDRVPKDAQLGLFLGYLGIPHLFLQLSSLFPNAKIEGQDLRYWAGQYLAAEREDAPKGPKPTCGLINDNLCHKALKACLSGKLEDVDAFLNELEGARAAIPEGEEDAYATELLLGRAGALYLLRLVRSWVPSRKGEIDGAIAEVAEHLMRRNDYGAKSWYWHNGCYAGSVHGDIGNMTQLVLSVPSLAWKMEAHLERLLAMQFPDGGWPMFTDRGETKSEMVQFCHGTTGFVFSLKVLRPHFPRLRTAIDASITKSQECVWEKGLLRKEPSICHGILGNAL